MGTELRPNLDAPPRRCWSGFPREINELREPNTELNPTLFGPPCLPPWGVRSLVWAKLARRIKCGPHVMRSTRFRPTAVAAAAVLSGRLAVSVVLRCSEFNAQKLSSSSGAKLRPAVGLQTPVTDDALPWVEDRLRRVLSACGAGHPRYA